MRRKLLIGAGVIAGIFLAIAYQAPGIAAGGLLHPNRVTTVAEVPDGCEEHQLAPGQMQLSGWRCTTPVHPRRGTIVYLHGIADNRSSSIGAIRRYVPRGFDVLAYDSRAHGRSEGNICTYGFHEKHDLRRIVDTAAPGPIVLFGTSLGAAIALQEAVDDPRISSIVAAEVFSDLRAIALERAPTILPWWVIDRAFAIAEQRGEFKVEEVSPRAAAERIQVPVLLIHGAEDRDTSPAHSKRVYEALRGPKRLLLVEGAGHNASLSAPATWEVIDEWIGAIHREAM